MKKDTNEQPVYGCITEQGDLGLGFDVLNEQDQEVLREKDSQPKKQDY